jgi:hypothetical protein
MIQCYVVQGFRLQIMPATTLLLSTTLKAPNKVTSVPSADPPKKAVDSAVHRLLFSAMLTQLFIQRKQTD